MREVLEMQGELLRKGTVVPLERVLIHKGYLPRDAMESLHAKPPIESQPFTNYRVLRAAGEGGSSIVYEGVYVPNGTRVAVKVLNAVQGLRRDLRERFYEEARLLIQLEHENIVAGYEVGCNRGLHFFSMDWIEGPTVLDMIDRAGHIENPTAISITVQVARALDYLHHTGLLHRDVKPGNVMIDASGRARLIDLGLVRHLSPMVKPPPGTPAPEDDATTVGTVEYISPEQARGRGDLDVRTDVYSLGVSLYHMVVGDVPFHGETNYEVMAKHILSVLETQKVKTRRISPEIHYFITKMMSKDREQRYRSAAEVVEELSGFLPPEGAAPMVLPISTPPMPGSGPGPVSPPIPPRAPIRKSPVPRRRFR